MILYEANISILYSKIKYNRNVKKILVINLFQPYSLQLFFYNILLSTKLIALELFLIAFQGLLLIYTYVRVR